MKKLTILLLTLVLSASFATAQFKVLAVDADLYGPDEFALVDTALQNSGFDFTIFVPDTNMTYDSILTYYLPYDTLQQYDMILWYAGNDGVDSLLWDYHNLDTPKFVPGLLQFIANGGVLWIDGIDVIYDMYGGAPDDFQPGDFVYDVLGIAKYLSQSKADDGGLGVAYLTKSPSNNITTVGQISWVYSTLWYVDGYELTPYAHALYQMGGDSDYPLLGQISALYKGNVIFTNFRMGKFRSQGLADTIVYEILSAAQNGAFQPVASVFDNWENITVYPNPAHNYICLTIDDIRKANLELTDLSGRVLIKRTLYKGNNIIDLSGIAPGVYIVKIASENRQLSQKIIVQ